MKDHESRGKVNFIEVGTQKKVIESVYLCVSKLGPHHHIAVVSCW